jgi:hypothetical protein
MDDDIRIIISMNQSMSIDETIELIRVLQDSVEAAKIIDKQIGDNP